MPLTGGEETRITEDGGFLALGQPNGGDLYYTERPGVTALWRQPASGGQRIKVADSVNNGVAAVAVDAGIYFVHGSQGQTQLQFYDFATAKTATVLRSLGNVIAFIAASRDGRTISLEAGLFSNRSELVKVPINAELSHLDRTKHVVRFLPYCAAEATMRTAAATLIVFALAAGSPTRRGEDVAPTRRAFRQGRCRPPANAASGTTVCRRDASLGPPAVDEAERVAARDRNARVIYGDDRYNDPYGTGRVYEDGRYEDRRAAATA